MDQFFSQPEFVIRHGAVLWTDELRDVPTLALRDVDIVLRNGGTRFHDHCRVAWAPGRGNSCR